MNLNNSLFSLPLLGDLSLQSVALSSPTIDGAISQSQYIELVALFQPSGRDPNHYLACRYLTTLDRLTLSLYLI